VLAVCGGGSDGAALLVTGLVAGAWVLLALLVVKGAQDRRERITLIILALVSSVVGPAILFGLLDGFDGDNEHLPEGVITLLLPGFICACIAIATRKANAARAFFLVLWGAVFVPGAYVVLVIAALTIGTGCLS
jgi:uncharacterized membrane protein YjjP (DUF1212 family)